MENLNNVLSSNLLKLRKLNNLTQAELANKLQYSDKTISKWETAKGYPDITLLEPIAKVFGISGAGIFKKSFFPQIFFGADI